LSKPTVKENGSISSVRFLEEDREYVFKTESKTVEASEKVVH
jgi:hypothetical protein